MPTNWIFWILFNIFVLAMLALDLGVFHREKHVVEFREAIGWTIVWITLAGALQNGYGPADSTLVASFGKTNLGKMPVRLRLTLVHPVNPGTPESVTSGILRPA